MFILGNQDEGYSILVGVFRNFSHYKRNISLTWNLNILILVKLCRYCFRQALTIPSGTRDYRAEQEIIKSNKPLKLIKICKLRMNIYYSKNNGIASHLTRCNAVIFEVFTLSLKSGPGGNRTRVQKPVPCTSTIIVSYLTFPLPYEN